MKNGYLKKYFTSIIAKKLSVVETTPKKSNQHEFNANKGMKRIFGMDDRKFKTSFLYIDDDSSVTAEEFLTWYDARRNHPTRTEYRLYYPSTIVSQKASEGDTLFICMKPDDTIMCIIAKREASITSQLYWLFDIDQESADHFVQNDELNTDSMQLEFAVRIILDQIGIEYEEENDEDLLEPLLLRFNGNFPKTDIFSAYARSLVKYCDPVGDPDGTLIQWFSKEEKLFFLMEQHLIKERLKTGFYTDNEIDVDGFVKFSLSVQNRRKSRAGLSLENHISALLEANNIRFSHTPVTENRAKPDFLFPEIACYRDPDYPAQYLTMLGSKSTCKDRWRQVLAEADRIDRKHLLTLEAAISKHQTDEMIDKNLQLVVPASIQKTYTAEQQTWLYTVDDLIRELREKQRYYAYAKGLTSALRK